MVYDLRNILWNVFGKSLVNHFCFKSSFDTVPLARKASRLFTFFYKTDWEQKNTPVILLVIVKYIFSLIKILLPFIFLFCLRTEGRAGGGEDLGGIYLRELALPSHSSKVNAPSQRCIETGNIVMVPSSILLFILHQFLHSTGNPLTLHICISVVWRKAV